MGDLIFNLTKLNYIGGMQSDADVATKIPDIDLYIALCYNQKADFDWFLVRQYLATEPVWGSWGVQETAP